VNGSVLEDGGSDSRTRAKTWDVVEKWEDRAGVANLVGRRLLAPPPNESCVGDRMVLRVEEALDDRRPGSSSPEGFGEKFWRRRFRPVQTD
jgi:hypothetical protein